MSSKNIGLGAGLALLVLLAPVFSHAQPTRARRRVAAGEVTGLEMGIDGSLRAVRGGTVRWFVTLYEVLRRRDLRPAPGATLRVTASFAPGEPIQIVQTDSAGHAAIEIPIPIDFHGPPQIRVEAVSPRHVRRVFSVGLVTAPVHLVELYVDRQTMPLGASFSVVGRVSSAATGALVADEEVTLLLAGEGSVGAPVEVRTDARGVFSVDTLSLPAVGHHFQLSARSDHGHTSRILTATTVDRPALWVETRAPAVLAPGQTVAVEVFVRTVAGEPVSGAHVAWQGADEDEPVSVTDAEGRASLPWQMSTLVEPMRVVARSLVVTDPGRGTVIRQVSARLSRVPVLTSWAVDGGALVPGLTGRVYVRVVEPDGTPYRGPVTLTMARLGGSIVSTTDEHGVAVFEGPVGVTAAGGSCGGATVSEATLIVFGAPSERLCLPLDPDATLRVASARPVSEGLEVRLERVAAARRAPVEVMALVSREGSWEPVARAFVAGGRSGLTLALPDAVRGEIWVRARPILDGGVAVRGGSRLIHRGRGAMARSLTLDASESGARVSAPEGATVAIFAGDAHPMAPAHLQHTEELRRAVHTHLGAVGAALDRGRSDRFVQGLLAARTPVDVAASMSLRGGERVPQPMPSEPVGQGLLRDPWRTRARFVRGRIGRLMRAVEAYVEASIPDSMDEVGVRDGRGWRFNHALLEAALEGQGLGEETATALDGEPLDIEGLRALDPSFTFDHVAARITRERLFRVLVMLREVVQELDLDLPWGRRGDPRDLVPGLLDLADTVSFEHESPSRELLFDGWGRPFVLRPVRGRARQRFLAPVHGFELVSSGPDGRVGTRDDVVDPFARVLPSSGIYADAVGEDILLARIGGVVLGRATLASLRHVFDLPSVRHEAGRDRAHATWGSLPEVVMEPRLRAPALDPLVSPIGGLGAERSWSLPNALRTYRATALRFDAEGGLHMAEDRFVAGAPWIARLELPPTLHPGDALRVPVELLRLADAPPPTVTVSVTGRGVEASVEEMQLSLRATRPGLARISVVVRAGERVVSRFERQLRVVPDGMLLSRVTVARVDGEAEITVETPDGARPWGTRLTVGAPRALASDPAFVVARTEAPGIFVWAQAMAGVPVDPEALAAATSGQAPLPLACAMVAWAGDERYAPRVSGAARAVREGLGDDLWLRASVLAALASSAPTLPGGGDPTSRLVTDLREDGWRALARTGASPSTTARMAAGLLLADRDDSRGRALLRRARNALTEDPQGRRWVPGDTARAGDGWIGTLALAIAARQVGQDALADELGAVALSRLYLADRTGPEGAFWAIAASVYGVFGVDGPETVEVRSGDGTESLSLEAGVAELPLEAGSSVQITAPEPVWARLESRYIVPFVARTDGALRARIEGTPGRAGRTAGLELVVANVGDESSGTPVVEVVMPGAAVLDASVRAAMQRVEGVLRVSAPDGAGVVRVYLAPLVEGMERRLPLPWRWVGAGQTRGLALVAYDASTPHLRSVREGSTLTIEEAP